MTHILRAAQGFCIIQTIVHPLLTLVACTCAFEFEPSAWFCGWAGGRLTHFLHHVTINLLKAAFNVMAKYNTALISLERDRVWGGFNGGCIREIQKRRSRKKEHKRA